jgi:hypothetical protein
VRGQVVLASSEFRDLLTPAHPIQLEGRGRYFVSYPVDRLIDATRVTLQDDLRLAGKTIAA